MMSRGFLGCVMLFCICYSLEASALDAPFYGLAVRPYGAMDFAPTTEYPDLTVPDPLLPMSSGKLARAQKDCNYFIFQVKRLINSATYPNPEVWFNNGDTENNTLAKSLFNPNVNARISPLGIFPGFKFTVQYYYALPYYWFPIKSSYVDHLTCTGNVVSYRLTMEMMRPAGRNTSQWSIVQFDAEGRIKTLDAMFYNLGGLYDYYKDTPAGFIPIVNTNTSAEDISYVLLNGTRVTYPGGSYTYNLQNIYMICQISALGYSSLSANPMSIPGGTCQGANAQWNNTYGLSQFDYCMNWIQNEIPYGSWNWGNRNNTVCRLVHTQLTYFDPDDHCPHVGWGGAFCRDFPYDSYFPPGVPGFSVGVVRNKTNY